MEPREARKARRQQRHDAREVRRGNCPTCHQALPEGMTPRELKAVKDSGQKLQS
jgi:hypothetical protein